jgi:AraC-like DNA-binding protein
MASMDLHILAVDCCEHILAVLDKVPASRLTSIASTDKSRTQGRHDVDLIVIGVARYPVRRLFISQLRRVYPDVPVMILRRLENGVGSEDLIRGEFILSETPGNTSDLEIVRALRNVLPIHQCEHLQKDHNYDTVRAVIRVVAEHYSEPHLDLQRVARELDMSPAVLSRILNQQVGISFRQLLGTTRIEEAKRMLASRQYSVKEVAVRVGFADSHYFSRSFKKQTGMSASEYHSQDPIFG